MKKAKIFLTALTVLAVVGGALAFKTKTFKQFGTCDLNDKVCSITVTNTQETTTLIGSFRPYDELNATCDEQNPCETFVKFSI